MDKKKFKSDTSPAALKLSRLNRRPFVAAVWITVHRMSLGDQRPRPQAQNSPRMTFGKGEHSRAFQKDNRRFTYRLERRQLVVLVAALPNVSLNAQLVPQELRTIQFRLDDEHDGRGGSLQVFPKRRRRLRGRGWMMSMMAHCRRQTCRTGSCFGTRQWPLRPVHCCRPRRAGPSRIPL
jgi:hypothetical protein